MVRTGGGDFLDCVRGAGGGVTSVPGQVRGRRGVTGGAGSGLGRPWPPGAFDQNGAPNTGMVDDQPTSLSRTFTEFVSAHVSTTDRSKRHIRTVERSRQQEN